MLDFFKLYRVVLVTGPQRSGTRIGAHIIAHDSELDYVDETEFFTHDEDEFSAIVKSGFGVVIQCPALCHTVHRYSSDDIAIVMMVRDVHEIIASQKRVGWKGEKRELKKYDRIHGIISEVKYSHWIIHQRPVIHNAFEVSYRGLEGHELWLPKEKRATFGPLDWKI